MERGRLAVDDEVQKKVRAKMREDGLTYAQALTRLLSSDQALKGRYERAHCRELCEEPTPRDLKDHAMLTEVSSLMRSEKLNYAEAWKRVSERKERQKTDDLLRRFGLS